MDTAFLIAIIHNSNGIRWLFQYSNLELPATAVIVGQETSHWLEGIISSGVIDL